MGPAHERCCSDQQGSRQIVCVRGRIYKAELEILCLLRMQVLDVFNMSIVDKYGHPNKSENKEGKVWHMVGRLLFTLLPPKVRRLSQGVQGMWVSILLWPQRFWLHTVLSKEIPSLPACRY